MKYRIKEIRKVLKLSQAEMGNKLNLARATIAAYEVGNSIPSERTLKDICSTFGVNEQWLRTGEGMMFKEQRTVDAALAFQVGKMLQGKDDFTKDVVYTYLSLTDEQKKALQVFIEKLVATRTRRAQEQ